MTPKVTASVAPLTRQPCTWSLEVNTIMVDPDYSYCGECKSDFRYGFVMFKYLKLFYVGDGMTVLLSRDMGVFYLRKSVFLGLGCKGTSARLPPAPAVPSLHRCSPCVPLGGPWTGTAAVHSAAVPPRGQPPSSTSLWGTLHPAPGVACSSFASPVPWRKCDPEVLERPTENNKLFPLLSDF